MNALKHYRQQKGYTQKELALQCDVNLRTLQDYEQGHKKLIDAKADTLYRLAKGLGCSMEDLIANDGQIIEYQQIDASSRNKHLLFYSKEIKKKHTNQNKA